ncbi:hypothetical protein [Lutimonas sp.]|uniref:hypothetical protein n=1 Tax=Lutimonas sp. TaxID=1872403 RepID=UPI003D9B08CD
MNSINIFITDTDSISDTDNILRKGGGKTKTAELANTYPNSKLLLNHWGTADAPDFSPFNADPEVIKKLVVHPERIVILAPGQPFLLEKLKN